jgi:triacylglycerol lipase
MIGRAGRRGSANASGGPRYVIPSAMPPVLASSVTPFSPGGKWQCTWGPATDPDDTNLVFVATCAIVVIRGTDVDTGDICGIIKQAFEDFTVIFQSTPPWLSSDSGVYVVDRTLAGLEMIQGLTSGDQSLEAYLTSPANGNPVLVAAGHKVWEAA